METRKSNLSRSQRKQKRRATNMIMSAFIFLGLAVIIIFGTNLFIGSFQKASNDNTYETKDENTTKDADESQGASVDTEGSEDHSVVDDEEIVLDEEGNENEETSTTPEESNETSGDRQEDDATVNEGQWEPIGTEQEEPHVSNYEIGSVDWDEKVKAIAYATNHTEDEFEILWLGNNGDHNSAIGVIAMPNQFDNPEIVYLDWITNKGWKPVKVANLNDLSEEEQKAIKAKYTGE